MIIQTQTHKMATHKITLHQVQAEAKKIKSKHPGIKHTEAVKKAWANLKKINGVKYVESGESPSKPPNRILKIERESSKGKHPGAFKKFVQIGSVNSLILSDYTKAMTDCERLENDIKESSVKMKMLAVSERSFMLKQIELKKRYLKELLKHKTELKKLL